MILRIRSGVVLVIVLSFIGFLIIPAVSAGPLLTKSTTSISLSGKLITIQTDKIPFQIPNWYVLNNALTAKSDPLPYNENSTACGFGYCGSNSFLTNNSDSGVLSLNITPYYPPKFWNYLPPGYMPLVPHTNPAFYYSDTSTASGLTNGFEKEGGFLFT